jgi:hypothetical protein
VTDARNPSKSGGGSDPRFGRTAQGQLRRDRNRRVGAPVTRLAGDDVHLDEIELLLVALKRAGHLSRPDALALQVRYLHEATPRAPAHRLTASQTY